MQNDDIPRHSLTFHLGTNREITVTEDGRRETRIVAYDHDDLKVTGKNLDFLKDPRFQRAYSKGATTDHKFGTARDGGPDIHIEYRVYMLLWAASHALKLPGDFVECGVNTGICSLAIYDYTDFGSSDKQFYLFDTFNGIPQSQMSEKESRSRQAYNDLLYDECYQQTLDSFSEYPNARLIRGEVPESLQQVEVEQVSYLHLDMNITYPEVEALRHFWPRMTAGGIVMLDDYAWHGHGEQKAAMDEFAAAVKTPICTLPTGQGMLIKTG